MQPLSKDAWRALAPMVQERSSPQQIVEFARRLLGALDAGIVCERLEKLAEYEGALEDLADKGVYGVAWFEDTYPRRVVQRLGEKAPPMLFAGGNLELLNSGAIGIVGSRGLDESGASFAEGVAVEAVRQGFGVVSGGAKGTDIVSMSAAVGSGGSTIGYMSDSLSKGLKSPEIRDALDEGRVCLASPFSPFIGFQVANAMARNKLIYAHALATVVVSASEGEGGTWAGATEALRLGLGPVLVRSDEDSPPGNHALIKRGGERLGDPQELWPTINGSRHGQASFGF
ncbi:MAG: DNA-processing protein DprA [Fimbriimonadaceae bacterium]